MQYRKEPVVVEAHQWFKNGDHPEDNPTLHHDSDGGPFKGEGKVVRYYRRPDSLRECEKCGRLMHEHGWIDTLEGGHIVCPADWIVTGVKGEKYPIKPDILAATYEPIEEPEPSCPSLTYEQLHDLLVATPNSAMPAAAMEAVRQQIIDQADEHIKIMQLLLRPGPIRWNGGSKIDRAVSPEDMAPSPPEGDTVPPPADQGADETPGPDKTIASILAHVDELGLAGLNMVRGKLLWVALEAGDNEGLREQAWAAFRVVNEKAGEIDAGKAGMDALVDPPRLNAVEAYFGGGAAKAAPVGPESPAPSPPETVSVNDRGFSWEPDVHCPKCGHKGVWVEPEAAYETQHVCTRCDNFFRLHNAIPEGGMVPFIKILREAEGVATTEWVEPGEGPEETPDATPGDTVYPPPSDGTIDELTDEPMGLRRDDVVEAWYGGTREVKAGTLMGYGPEIVKADSPHQVRLNRLFRWLGHPRRVTIARVLVAHDVDLALRVSLVARSGKQGDYYRNPLHFRGVPLVKLASLKEGEIAVVLKPPAAVEPMPQAETCDGD